jgi:uncharacterized protein
VSAAGRDSGGDLDPVAATRIWLEQAVIGLNLCPFAKGVHLKNQIRWVESTAVDAAALRDDLAQELTYLAASDAAVIETTLLIHPHVLSDFLDYNDFLDVADATVRGLGLAGVIQVASFHPEYQFAESARDDISNFTNRSPHPMLHLLREDSISKAVAATPDASSIYERNIGTLRRLGKSGWHALMSKAG